MKVTRQTIQDVEVVRLEGQFALLGVKTVRTEIKTLIEDPSILKILINMAGVDMMDSSGIGYLITCYKTAKRRQAQLVLCTCQPIVRKILKSTSLDNLITSYESEELALIELSI